MTEKLNSRSHFQVRKSQQYFNFLTPTLQLNVTLAANDYQKKEHVIFMQLPDYLHV